MKYRVIIKKCTDQQRAAAIAKHIAAWSGCRYKSVFAALTSKSVCIRKEADENEAFALSKQFEDFGAEVELVRLGAMPAENRAKKTVGLEKKSGSDQSHPARPDNADDEDEDEEEAGRVLTDEEYALQVKQRADIFFIEKDSRLRNMESVCLVVGLVAGLWLSTREIIDTPPDFFEKLNERSVNVITEVPRPHEPEPEPEKPRPQEHTETARKVPNPPKNQGQGGRKSGGGDPRSRITTQGVLGIVAGHVEGKTIASSDPFGKGGFTEGIDAILSGVGGLKDGGDAGSGRKGITGIGFGTGYGSGMGEGSGGVDDLLAGLMPSDPAAGLKLREKPNPIPISIPGVPTGGALVGGRSKAGIMRVVMQNLAALRYAYNQRLREMPGIKGKVTVKFAIDEFGKVIFCKVIDSSMDDETFEKLVVGKVRRWAFDRIDKPGDVTEVVYPFVFSQ